MIQLQVGKHIQSNLSNLNQRKALKEVPLRPEK
jgi:hypothetical protein